MRPRVTLHLLAQLVLPAETSFNNETRLLFYALHKQATAGQCKEAKPWSWNVVESAKWQSWSQLGDMSSMDAMRLYVKTLDEEQVGHWVPAWQHGCAVEGMQAPSLLRLKAALGMSRHDQGAVRQCLLVVLRSVRVSSQPPRSYPHRQRPMPCLRCVCVLCVRVQAEWWTRLPSEPAPGSPDAAAAAAGTPEGGVSISHVFQEGTWVVIQQDDAKKPLPRYEQGAALMGPNLYIMGGHYSESHASQHSSRSAAQAAGRSAAPGLQRRPCSKGGT